MIKDGGRRKLGFWKRWKDEILTPSKSEGSG